MHAASELVSGLCCSALQACESLEHAHVHLLLLQALRMGSAPGKRFNAAACTHDASRHVVPHGQNQTTSLPQAYTADMIGNTHSAQIDYQADAKHAFELMCG